MTYHRVDDGLCLDCWTGYPISCLCGGWIHASSSGPSKDGEAIARLCDRCGDDFIQAAPLHIDGEPHAVGQEACPACQPYGTHECVCGGLIHRSPPGRRACDRCGNRLQLVVSV